MVRIAAAVSTVSLIIILLGCGSTPATEPVKPGASPAKILQFYASPAIVPKGGETTVCYGVENAVSVQMEPAVEQLKPALNRCFSLKVSANQSYTLIATGEDGKQVKESLSLKVGGAAAAPASAAPPAGNGLITTFISNAKEARAGDPVTVCYGVKNATEVRLDPGGRTLAVRDQTCITVQPEKTTTYTLVASGAGGKQDKQSLTITVH